MTKAAKVPGGILSNKGMAQPMPATAPLARENASAVIEWRATANGRPPLTPPAGWSTRLRAAPRVRVYLRLDRERHARLTSFCAFVRGTQQKVLVQALDEFFARHGVDEAAGDRRRPIPE